MNFSPYNQHFICKRKVKNVPNFRTIPYLFQWQAAVCMSVPYCTQNGKNSLRVLDIESAKGLKINFRGHHLDPLSPWICRCIKFCYFNIPVANVPLQGSHRNSKTQFHDFSMIFHDRQCNFHDYLMHGLQPAQF